MEVLITSFTNPFSFFCILECDVETILPFETSKVPHDYTGTIGIDKLEHGQYISVLWRNKWVRGIVDMENQMQIWLVDYGTHLRADEKIIWTELSPQLKKLPSKVFEVSVHGVMAVDKEVNEECNIVNKTSTTWTLGAINQAKKAISSALGKATLQPVALLTSSHNDVVLANVFLDIPRKGMINLLDELDHWPMFFKKDEAAYIENLSQCYKERRRHRACTSKPDFPGLPVVTSATTHEQYSAICAETPQLEPQPAELCYTEVSTKLEDKKLAFLTPEEMEEYANMYVNVSGREYNLLNILVNKMRDINMCYLYKDHDLKGIGRGVSYGESLK